MQQWNGRWLKQRGWQEPLEEIRRFLETWYFHISVSGHLYVRPLRETIFYRDVHAFLRRLDVLENQQLPDSMTFDFRAVPMAPHRWRRMTQILRQYAQRIDFASPLLFESPPAGGIALIPRSIDHLEKTVAEVTMPAYRHGKKNVPHCSSPAASAY